MPNWKKVITSGSNAVLNEITSSGGIQSTDVNIDGLLNMSSVSNAGVDTDKFLVLDGTGNVDYRTGAQVLSDIGAGSSTNQIHPVQLVADTKNLSSGHISWFSISDLQPNANRGFTTWIAPSDGYLEKVIVSPEQTNTTTDNVRIGLVVDGTTQSSTQSVIMGAAGTNKTFTFGSSNYSFTSGERLGLSFDKQANTADLYNVMVIFRLNS